jgi:hypothetical protein
MGDYHRNMILAAFHNENPGVLKPSATRLTKYEETLGKRYDDELLKQAEEHGINPNKFNRSLLLLFAVQADVDAVEDKVDEACRYFKHVDPQP